MNKILLSGLAGLAVINAANADINLRRAMCEDIGNVWVEKTEECVPANTCDLNSDFPEIYDEHCILLDLVFDEYRNKSIIKKYSEQVLGSTVSEMKDLGPLIYDWGDGEFAGSARYLGVKLDDGGYFTFPYGESEGRVSWLTAILFAFRAYGYNGGISGLESADIGNIDAYLFEDPVSKDVCEDIADFASLLWNGKSIQFVYEPENEKCYVGVPKGTEAY